MAIENLLDKALLGPDLPTELLKNGKPVNRAAVGAPGKGYLGNEASTLTHILTEREPEDL